MTGHTAGTVALDALMVALGVLWLVTPTYGTVLGERASASRRQRRGADGSSLAGPLAEHDQESKDSAVPATGTPAESVIHGG